MISTQDLRKTYRLGAVKVPVLRGVDLSIRRGEWLAVLGASGSGKSTLLHLLGALDRPDRGGRIEFDGRALHTLGARDLDRFRARRVGFIFQFYHLLPELSVLENVLVAAMVRHGRLGYRRASDRARRRASELLERLGLAHRLAHRPAELSGGERQRVAIARAMVNDPEVILADEPTGNLDRETGGKVLSVLADLRAEQGRTMVTVTHDSEVAARADRVVHLRDGLLVSPPPPKPE